MDVVRGIVLSMAGHSPDKDHQHPIVRQTGILFSLQVFFKKSVKTFTELICKL